MIEREISLNHNVPLKVKYLYIHAWWYHGSTFTSHHYSLGLSPGCCGMSFTLHSQCLVVFLLGFSSTIRRALSCLRRLCFYRCLSVHGGVYPSMPCSLAGHMTSRGCLGFGLGGCGQAKAWGVCPGPGLGDVSQDALRQTHTPQADSYCCGRYASYWNAFLFLFCLGLSHKTKDGLARHSSGGHKTQVYIYVLPLWLVMGVFFVSWHWFLADVSVT